MTRAVREVLQFAEREGLKVKRIVEGSRHTMVVVANANGLLTRITVSRGARGNAGRQGVNCRATLRRFARGSLHDIKAIPQE